MLYREQSVFVCESLYVKFHSSDITLVWLSDFILSWSYYNFFASLTLSVIILEIMLLYFSFLYQGHVLWKGFPGFLSSSVWYINRFRFSRHTLFTKLHKKRLILCVKKGKLKKKQ